MGTERFYAHGAQKAFKVVVYENKQIIIPFPGIDQGKKVENRPLPSPAFQIERREYRGNSKIQGGIVGRVFSYM